VWPASSSYSGGCQIGFNTGFLPPGASPVDLTADTWANGSLPENGQQWFTFTATAAAQYIHFAPGTLTYLYAQVYTGTGATVGDEAYLYSGTLFANRSVSSGSVYYIRVRPSSGSGGGYQIAFNTGSTAPAGGGS
jgi:hypothetical protein